MPESFAMDLPHSLAERAVAELWLCTERNDLRAPDVTVQFTSDEWVRLTVSTGGSRRTASFLRAWSIDSTDEMDAALVRAMLLKSRNGLAKLRSY